MVPSTNQQQTYSTSPLLRVLSRLKDQHYAMTVQQAMYLMYIAANPGSTQARAYEGLGSSDCVAGRTLAILSEQGRQDVMGLNLVVMKINPNDRRERLLYLTPKGQHLMDDIMKDLNTYTV